MDNVKGVAGSGWIQSKPSFRLARHQHQLLEGPRRLGGLCPNSLVVHGTENIPKTCLLSSVHIVPIWLKSSKFLVLHTSEPIRIETIWARKASEAMIGGLRNERKISAWSRIRTHFSLKLLCGETRVGTFLGTLIRLSFQRPPYKIQFDPTYLNPVISNSPLFWTLIWNNFPWIILKSANNK